MSNPFTEMDKLLYANRKTRAAIEFDARPKKITAILYRLENLFAKGEGLTSEEALANCLIDAEKEIIKMNK